MDTRELTVSTGRGRALIDLTGACADYLDIEPRLNLNEIEPRPERLDRQLLEVMLSHHPSGLAVIAALTVFVALEKLGPFGPWGTRISGAALVTMGCWMLLR